MDVNWNRRIGDGAEDCMWSGRTSQRDSPHTVHRMNSILASFSLVKSRLIAMAACATMIAPM